MPACTGALRIALDLRTNPLTGDTVLVVPGRAGRPGARGRTTRIGDAATCPFCEGHEQLTPPEVAALGRPDGAPDSPGWTVRVVPNKYPAFPGHEVVVHGPAHITSLGELRPEVLESVVAAWRDRRATHMAAGTGHLLVGVNEGPAAGASLDHSHSQLVPFAEPPPLVQREMAAFRDGCPLCRAAENVVREEDGLITFCPAWSRLPYETWIMPSAHAATAPLAPSLGAALCDAVVRLRRLLDPQLAWNAVLHEVPPGSEAPFHWHMELLPRLTVQASIELGAGVWVNVIDPGRAARELAGIG